MLLHEGYKVSIYRAKVGEEKVIAAFKRSDMEASTSNLDKLCMYFGFSKREEFFYAVEKGDVTLPENIKKLLKEKTLHWPTGD